MFGRAASSLLARTTGRTAAMKLISPTPTAAMTRFADAPRFLSNGKKQKHKKGGGGKPQGGGGGGGVALRFCWGEYDMDDEDVTPEDVLKFKGSPSIQDIQKKLESEFGMESDTLQYKDENGEWGDLTRPQEQLRAGSSPRKPILIRDPNHFDDGSGDFDDEYDMKNEDYDADDDDEDPFAKDYEKMMTQDSGDLTETILDLVKDLKAVGERPVNGKLKWGEGQAIEIRQWVLNRAADNDSLQELLLSRPGALDHIAQCLHYDFVWKMAESDVEGDDGMKEGEIVDRDSRGFSPSDEK